MKKLSQLIILIFINILYAQHVDYEVFNTSINSNYADLGITFLNNNEVIFASSKKDKNDTSFKKNRRKNNRQLHLKFYKGVITANGDIIATNTYINNSNSPFFQADLTFSPDYKTVYFTWNNFYNSQSKKDSAKWKTLHIVKASINDNFELSNIISLPFNSAKYSNRNPYLSKNGKKLFYISDNPEGYGGTDIYAVDVHKNGTYGEPKNLGKNINTKKSELFPFETANNTLYFSSYGHRGKGGLDIFKSKFVNNSYQTVENLPNPINSAFDDFAFVIKQNDTSGYFTSTREKGKGDADIYGFKLKKVINKVLVEKINSKKVLAKQVEPTKNIAPVLKPKLTLFEKIEDCNQTISGLLMNTSGEQLDSVRVSLYKNNALLESTIILKGYRYQFNLKCDSNYKIIAEKENYKQSEITINTDATNASKITKTLVLPYLKCTQLLSGTVLETKSNKKLRNALVTVFKGNVLIDTLKLNKLAEFTTELNCNTQYRIEASQENYHDDVAVIFVSRNPNKNLNRKLVLEPYIEFVSSNKQKMIKVDAINFELNKFNITKEAAIELNKVVAVLSKYPTMKIEIKSHTDSRAPDAYNMNITNKRAEAIINYIVSKDIDAERVTGRGYGETELLNKCTNGVKCSEAEHQKNRRTEFIITEN